ncbi:uncharacterized protein [Eurosta solidaginis]|uniref:uncharacterized protein n=1 Tax=Eurosta solidaginis TaxID=178769 RepID=UPI0035307D42
MTLTYNDKYGYLDSKSQSTVAHCIVDSYIGNSVKMTYAEMQKLANAICDVFPKEKSLVFNIYTILFNSYYIEIDFESLYPGKGNLLFLKLETFYKSILDIFDKEIKARPSRALYLKHLYNKNISNDSKYCIITILLHALLPPQRLNKNDKPTIADAQNDFVTLVGTPNDIQPKVVDIINQFAERKENCQPRIIAVGTDITCVSEFYIFCDAIKWKCCSYMKCVDIIIKLSYVFNTEYSQRSKLVWAFLAQYFFELKSEDFSSVAILLGKLV